jgi:hypothetical protein
MIEYNMERHFSTLHSQNENFQGQLGNNNIQNLKMVPTGRTFLAWVLSTNNEPQNWWLTHSSQASTCDFSPI